VSISSVKIVGSGLIGTSIGLALSAAGVRVLMSDKDPAASALAQSLVGSHPQTESLEVFDVVILAVPPSSLTKVIEEESKLHPLSTFIDILSIKIKPLLEVQGYADVASRFVGTHPMAGREISGAQSARGDLFVGRTWIIATGETTQTQSVDLATELISRCGGIPVIMSAQDHDRAMALISHAPQMLASLLAATLIDANPLWLTLIGQGFRDFTRIADSDPLLWREILSENSENILPVLRNFRRRLEEVESTLNDPLVAQSVIELGNQGRKLIPGKHGKTARTYIYLHIVIDDKAGQLASIFNDCASADVNIEDVSIEHTPGQNTGLVTLSILEMAKAEHLEHFLSDHGWKVHLTRK